MVYEEQQSRYGASSSYSRHAQSYGNGGAVAKKRKRKRRAAIAVVIAAVIAAIVLAGIPIAERMYYKLDYREYITEASQEYTVNPYYIAAMIKCESNYDPNAVSQAGAVGLMQMMPETAKEISNRGIVDSKWSPDNLTDPQTNIMFGTAYIRYLVERYHEMNPALAAYNAGMGNVDKWLQNDSDIRGSIEFTETEKYLRSVNRAKEMYEKLYPDVFGS